MFNPHLRETLNIFSISKMGKGKIKKAIMKLSDLLKRNENPNDVQMGYEKSSNLEKNIRDLLECPVCMEQIKLGPIHQCTNGHITCRNCIPKLENCPICRNNSDPARNLILEQILRNIENSEANHQVTSTSNSVSLKWKPSRVHHSNNESNNIETIDVNDEVNELQGEDYVPEHDEVIVSEIDEILEIDERLENQLLFGNQRFIRNHQGRVADLESSGRPSTSPQLQTNKNLFHELRDEFCKIVMILTHYLDFIE